MAKNGSSIARSVASWLFGLCVAALLIIDTAILSSGQIGFLSVLIYYAVFALCAAVYWIAEFKSPVVEWRWAKLALTAIFAFVPLALTIYGYEGPA